MMTREFASSSAMVTAVGEAPFTFELPVVVIVMLDPVPVISNDSNARFEPSSYTR